LTVRTSEARSTQAGVFVVGRVVDTRTAVLARSVASAEVQDASGISGGSELTSVTTIVVRATAYKTNTGAVSPNINTFSAILTGIRITKKKPQKKKQK
jgi:hypothetical protein